ncbi:acid phosphatase-domain-containing protein [Kalaharituber pfeilii]|nr:acid phosphatase-domain-containing protein [Kalaharituber pfeilii]
MPRRRKPAPAGPAAAAAILAPPATLSDGLPLPKLNITTPTATLVHDAYSTTFTTYPSTPILLSSLFYHQPSTSICVAAASRTESPETAHFLLSNFRIPIPAASIPSLLTPPATASSEELASQDVPMSALFHHTEIYPAHSKLVHFRALHKCATATLDWNEVLFFDDESRNRDVERELGVMFCLVDEDVGVSCVVFDEAVREWRRRRRRREGMAG